MRFRLGTGSFRSACRSGSLSRGAGHARGLARVLRIRGEGTYGEPSEKLPGDFREASRRLPANFLSRACEHARAARADLARGWVRDRVRLCCLVSAAPYVCAVDSTLYDWAHKDSSDIGPGPRGRGAAMGLHRRPLPGLGSGGGDGGTPVGGRRRGRHATIGHTDAC